MICKRCETAVSGNSKKCPNCGASMRPHTNHQLWLAALVGVMALIVAALYVMYTQMRANQPVAPENLVKSVSPPGQPPNVAGEGGGGAGALQPEPVFSADPNKAVPEIEKMVLNVAQSAEKYRATFSETNEFVSKNGYLYDFPAEMYLSIKDLVDTEGFNAEYANEEVMLLYVRGADMPRKSGGGAETGGLKVFAAYESAGSFIVSDGKDVFEVADSGVKGLLGQYGSEHGAVSQVSNGSRTFAATVGALGGVFGNGEGLDVRYMSEDDKYVSAVVSPKGDASQIREFVLLKNDGTCEITIEKIETFWQKFVTVNSAAPDVNLKLLPPYNLWRDVRDLKSDFSTLLESMAASGIIPGSAGDPVFISGNSEFVYMEFDDGARMLAHNDDAHNEWKVYPILRYDDAVLRMKEIAKFSPPPYFLIKQSQ